MAHACSSQGGFFRTQLFCIALTVVTSCKIYFSFGWMWLEFHWPLEHGTCPLAAGGQTAQLLRWPRSTAVLYIFHPKVPNLNSIPPCAPHRAQLTARLTYRRSNGSERTTAGFESRTGFASQKSGWNVITQPQNMWCFLCCLGQRSGVCVGSWWKQARLILFWRSTVTRASTCWGL